MTLLELVQSLHYEAKQPGSPPAAVDGLTGRPADLLRWIVEAYNDIQRDKAGKWKWLRRDFYVDTTADDSSYVYGDCTDTVAAAVISRFRAWALNDEEDPAHIYLVSDGASTERKIPFWDWIDFRSYYKLATHTSSYPACLSVDHADAIHLGPTPDGIYRLSGYYWRSNQTLAADADEPEMPVDYHMLIVYRAMVKYGYSIIAQELLARAQTEGQPIYDALVDNQWYGGMRLRLPGPIA